MDAKATDSFRDRNLSANYSCGFLRLRLESDWSQNNKNSRNNFRRSWFNGFHCKRFEYDKRKELLFMTLATLAMKGQVPAYGVKSIEINPNCLNSH